MIGNHWGGWGEFGYKVKVQHPSIHGGGWGWDSWKHVGPSKGWTTFYDTHKKSPKGWWHDPWKHEEHHHKKHHKKHHHKKHHKKEKHWW